jgi:hypothetical protein
MACASCLLFSTAITGRVRTFGTVLQSWLNFGVGAKGFLWMCPEIPADTLYIPFCRGWYYQPGQGRPTTVLRQWPAPVFSPEWCFNPRLKGYPLVSSDKTPPKTKALPFPFLSPLSFSHHQSTPYLLSFSYLISLLLPMQVAMAGHERGCQRRTE